MLYNNFHLLNFYLNNEIIIPKILLYVFAYFDEIILCQKKKKRSFMLCFFRNKKVNLR